MIKLNDNVIHPTIFPDRTSQVWKLPEEFMRYDYNLITWEFESEAEFFQVAQLKALLDITRGEIIELYVPYLPYARQDKNIANNATFAFSVFTSFLNYLMFDKVRVIDPHNLEMTKQLIQNVEVQMPTIFPLVKELKAEICYPDHGAAKRYGAKSNDVVCDKVREPLTGQVLGVKISDGAVGHNPYLIVDDICDGGRTFIEVAKLLYANGATEVHLYVSHGIFSKGLLVLRDAGIKRIFTYKGEVLDERNGNDPKPMIVDVSDL